MLLWTPACHVGVPGFKPSSAADLPAGGELGGSLMAQMGWVLSPMWEVWIEFPFLCVSPAQPHPLQTCEE